MRRLIPGLLWMAGCTVTVAPERLGGALPFGAPLLVRATLPAAPADPNTDPVLDEIDDFQPLDADRALLKSATKDGFILSLWSGSRGHVWSYRVPDDDNIYRILYGMHALPDAGVVIIPMLKGTTAGVIGLDLETGKERWRTMFPPAEGTVLEPHPLADRFGPGGSIHYRESRDTITIVAYAPASGEVRASMTVPQGFPWLPHVNRPRLVRQTRGHVLHPMPGPAPYDPADEHRWAVLRRDDLAPVGHIDAVLNMCSIDDRLYFAGGHGDLIRVDLGDPSLTRRQLDARASHSGLISCDRHGDEDIVWYAGHVLGIAPTGAIRWRIDLAGWELDLGKGYEHAYDPVRPTSELPDHAVMAVSMAYARDTRALLGLDLVQRRVTWLVPVASPLAYSAVLHDRRASHVQVAASGAADKQASVIATFDGDRGELTAAVLVDGLDPRSGQNLLVDGVLWSVALHGGFAIPEPVEVEAPAASEESPGSPAGDDKASEPPRRLAYGPLRLDSATLRPLDSPSGWTLYEALPWWSARLPRSEFFAGARAQVWPRPPSPPPHE